MPLCNPETRQKLFSDLYNDLLEDMDPNPIQPWDVMDQFPPSNSSNSGAHVLENLSSGDQAVSLASTHQVHSEAGSSMALRNSNSKAVSVGSSGANQSANVPKIVLQYSGIAVTDDDLDRLKPGMFLNDNLIAIGLQFWLDDMESTNPDLSKQIDLFSSFFYKKLTSKKNLSLQDAYYQVRKWAKNDIFQKKYLVIPINEDYHWYLVIIYEPGQVIKSPTSGQQDPMIIDGEDVPKTYIFTFDSMGGTHDEVIRQLSSYLQMEAKHKKGIDIPCIDGIDAKVPRQPNYCDCGVYLLHFVETFMSDPVKYAKMIMSTSQKISKEERKTLWLVDKKFGRTKRDKLRSMIEVLAVDWKEPFDCSQSWSKEEDGSEYEVEVLDFRQNVSDEVL